MSGAYKRTVATKLSRLAFRGRGKSAADALQAADDALEGLRDPCVEAISGTLTEIESRFGPAGADRAGARFADLRRLATRVVDASVFSREAGVDRAARSLCELVTHCEGQGVWDWVAVDLHIGALRLLWSAAQAIDPAEREAVIEGLRQIVRKRAGESQTDWTGLTETS